MNPNPMLGSVLSLVGRTCIRQLLCSVSRRQRTGLGKPTGWSADSSAGSSPRGFLAGLHDPGSRSLCSTKPWLSLIVDLFFRRALGIGGLTFGLTMRYLDMSLGMAVALGYTAAFGTLMPPIFRGEFLQVLGTPVGASSFSAAFSSAWWASPSRDAPACPKNGRCPRSRSRPRSRNSISRKGLVVATFSGVMSACFAYGLAAGDPIKAMTFSTARPAVAGLARAGRVLLGGFTTNFVWCVF